MSAESVTCAYCATELDVSLAFRRVVGWEHKAFVASRKGGSDIVLREHRDEFCCPGCIARMKAGISIGQEALV